MRQSIIENPRHILERNGFQQDPTVVFTPLLFSLVCCSNFRYRSIIPLEEEVTGKLCSRESAGSVGLEY